MTEMDEHVGKVQRIRCEITGAITRISADNDGIPRLFQGGGRLRGPAFEPFRKLEGHRPGRGCTKLFPRFRRKYL
jgi:hypothetical protein